MRRGPDVTSTCDSPLSQGVTSICVRPMKDAPVNPRRLPAFGIFGTPMTDPACVCTICWLLVPCCVVVVPSCVVVVQGHGGKNRTPQVRLPQPPAAWCYASAEHQAERECPWLCRPCAFVGCHIQLIQYVHVRMTSAHSSVLYARNKSERLRIAGVRMCSELVTAAVNRLGQGYMYYPPVDQTHCTQVGLAQSSIGSDRLV
jgi:hypothetical protein